MLAAGVDPERSALFVQSHVPEHAQLAWVLGGITGFGEASRMTQFKDKSSKGGAESSSVGLFTYPILMAADILIYQADQVPVGEDQRQHLELARNLAQRFNHRFGETFKVPEAYIVKETAKIYDLQDPTVKMSGSAASHNGVVNLTDDRKKAAKKISSAVTDSGDEVRFDEKEKPGVSNLLVIYSALTKRTIADIEREYVGQQYGAFKVALSELVADFVGPFGERTRELLDDRAELDRILKAGAEQARAVATETLELVYERSGFVRPDMTQTIGVAIPVPEPYGSLLRNKRAEFGDPMAKMVPSHVTLIAPTEVADAELDGVCDALERASASLPPFPMRLRGTATFRPVSPVVFIAVSQGISYTEMLAKAVRTALRCRRAGVPVPPARDGRAQPRRREPRPCLRRAERLRVPVHGRRVRALPPRRRRRVGPAAHLRSRPGAALARQLVDLDV